MIWSVAAFRELRFRFSKAFCSFPMKIAEKRSAANVSLSSKKNVRSASLRMLVLFSDSLLEEQKATNKYERTTL